MRDLQPIRTPFGLMQSYTDTFEFFNLFPPETRHALVCCTQTTNLFGILGEHYAAAQHMVPDTIDTAPLVLGDRLLPFNAEDGN